MADTEPSNAGKGATAAPEAPKGDDKPAEPKAPVLKLVDKVEAVLEGATAKAKWKVTVPASAPDEVEKSEWEYVAIARVQTLDLMKTGAHALLVKQVIKRACWVSGTKGDL